MHGVAPTANSSAKKHWKLLTAFDYNRYIFQGKGRKWLTLIKTLCLDVEWNSPKKSAKSRCGILNKRWYEKREDKNWAQLTPAVQSISITFTLNCQTIAKSTENRLKEGQNWSKSKLGSCGAQIRICLLSSGELICWCGKRNHILCCVSSHS